MVSRLRKNRPSLATRALNQASRAEEGLAGRIDCEHEGRRGPCKRADVQDQALLTDGTRARKQWCSQRVRPKSSGLRVTKERGRALTGKQWRAR
jgi:hypothetical protein